MNNKVKNTGYDRNNVGSGILHIGVGNFHAMQLIESGKDLSFFGHDQIVIAGLNLGIPALLATLYWGGMMVGRLVFSCFNNISPKWLLAATTVAASALIVIAMFTDKEALQNIHLAPSDPV